MKKVSARTIPPLGLVQLGQLGEISVRVVAANLQMILELPVNILDPQEIPAYAFQDHRQQYDAGLIIKHLSGLPYTGYLKIVALTNVDLCIPILTYVFGEAEIGGRVAVVSGYRLRYHNDGSIAPLDQYYERLAKVALHEVAHTFSVYHCENSKCVMSFSPKPDHLDEVELVFCERCEFMLRENLGHIRS